MPKYFYIYGGPYYILRFKKGINIENEWNAIWGVYAKGHDWVCRRYLWGHYELHKNLKYILFFVSDRLLGTNFSVFCNSLLFFVSDRLLGTNFSVLCNSVLFFVSDRLLGTNFSVFCNSVLFFVSDRLLGTNFSVFCNSVLFFVSDRLLGTNFLYFVIASCFLSVIGS